MATRRSASATKKVAKTASRKTAKRMSPAPAPMPAPPVVAATGSATLIVEQPRKLVRDSFTMPKTEYDAIAMLKSRLVRAERPTRKGELIRAGIAALAAMGDRDLLLAVERIPSLKTGRPKKSKSDSKGTRSGG